jgi:LysM repeat protein
MKRIKILGIVFLPYLFIISVLLTNFGCKTLPYKQKTEKKLEQLAPEEKTEILPPNEQWYSDFNSGIANASPDPEKEELRAHPTRPPSSALKLKPSKKSYIQDHTIHRVIKGETLSSIARRYQVSLESLFDTNQLTANSILRIGQEIIVPNSNSSTQVIQNRQIKSSQVHYTVQKGDTLSTIARRYGTTVLSIKILNSLKSSLIRVGQTLIIPETDNRMPSPPPLLLDKANASTHVVLPGETPGEIAKRYGMNTEELMILNNIKDPRKMQAGKKLIVKSHSEPQLETLIQREVLPKSSPVFKPPALSEPNLALDQENYQDDQDNAALLIPIEDTDNY